MLLFLISFIAGILTVLTPCVLPLLPIIVGGSLARLPAQAALPAQAGGGRRRAYTICISLGASIILFTLLLKVSTLFINVPQSAWQWISGGIVILFGLSMLFPQLWNNLPFVNALSRGSNKLLAEGGRRDSVSGDVLMGAALGPVFASCAARRTLSSSRQCFPRRS